MSFAAQIVSWQKQHGRHDLPWQNTTDAYQIWLSEIMLQQTQVVTVKDYYAKFLSRFPTVADLACAEQDDVLALWAGLGYYSRARNLHACAQAVLADWGGVFPATVHDLQSLKGIGASTAAAIAVFAFGMRAAILDGNVKRVLSRCFGVDAPANAATDKVLQAIAEREIAALSTPADYRAYTQGLMDLGASVCVRRKPSCAACPVQAQCVAHEHGLTEQLPRPKPPVAVREQTLTFYIYRADDALWLEQNPAKGIWAGLYVFAQQPRAQAGAGLALPAVKHRLTHRLLTLQATLFEVQKSEIDATGVWLTRDNCAAFGLPKPINDWLHALLST
ncbi:MAG: A/G-specific adenine glycosylase [Formosimonas sp.]